MTLKRFVKRGLLFSGYASSRRTIRQQMHCGMDEGFGDHGFETLDVSANNHKINFLFKSMRHNDESIKGYHCSTPTHANDGQ